MSEKNYVIKSKEEKNRELSIEVSVDQKFLEGFKDKAIKNAGKDLEIKGFRKGQAPKAKIIEYVGEMKILEEQAYMALNEILPKIVIEEKINSLTNPQIDIKKIAIGNDLEFKAIFILFPEIKLADYKKIAKEIPQTKKVEIAEKEIDDYINYIRKNRAEAELMKNKTSGDSSVRESAKDKKDLDLPEFNDDFVKTLGDFKNVEDFKNQLRENMQKEKEQKEKESRRIKIIEKIIEDSKIDIPEILIDDELNKMMNEFRFNIESMKINFEEYLKEIKKDEGELKKEWKTDATKRAKMNLILPQIALEEKIRPEEKTLEHEIKHLQSHYANVKEEQARSYLTKIMTNQKVFEFLEELK